MDTRIEIDPAIYAALSKEAMERKEALEERVSRILSQHLGATEAPQKEKKKFILPTLGKPLSATPVTAQRVRELRDELGV